MLTIERLLGLWACTEEGSMRFAEVGIAGHEGKIRIMRLGVVERAKRAPWRA